MEKFDDSRKSAGKPQGTATDFNKVMRFVFGIIMIVLYVGMGVLLLINFFGWNDDWDVARMVVGVVLIIYGFWRAYRQIKGID